jgi:hypothetical protein
MMARLLVKVFITVKMVENMLKLLHLVKLDKGQEVQRFL